MIDYENVEKLALENKPKILIAGGSAYSRIIDFKKFREIADKVKAYLLVDMAHFSGLVAGGAYPSQLTMQMLSLLQLTSPSRTKRVF